MERAALFHPRVFDDPEWADGYYKRNVKNIERVGKRFVTILKKSGFTKGRVLDTGCGFGTVAIELAKAFPDVRIVGIDLGEPLLKLGKSLVEKAEVGDRVTLLKGDVHRLEFETHAFDLVMNTFMLHVVDNPLEMLNEMERVAKADGRIMITDLRRIWLGLVVKKLKTAFTLDEAVEIIRKSNLRKGRFAKGPFWWDFMAGI